MAKKAKAKKDGTLRSLESQFETQLESLGLGDALRLADEYDNDIEVVTTGFPGLDCAIDDRGINAGIPKNRHLEIYSKKEHAGKTSLALAIGLTWQELGYRVGIIDIEPSITKQYLRDLGFIVDKETAEAQGKYAVRLLQPQVNPGDCKTDMIYLEQLLDLLSKALDVFDLVIFDSVDALVSELEADKATADNEKAGGIAKKLRGWFRKNTVRRGTCLFLNHAGQSIGSYGAPSYYTSGGKSVPRYSSLRMELYVADKLKEGDKDPYGFVTRVQLVKNRLGPNWRYVDLFYIFGEGFSREYDYFRQAVKVGILTKFGGWFYFLGEGKNEAERKQNARWKCQGEFNSYRQLTGKNPETYTDQDEAVWAEIKQLIQGEDLSADVKIGEVDPDAETLNRAEHDGIAES
jgi:RecA/RadA recombinase